MAKAEIEAGISLADPYNLEKDKVQKLLKIVKSQTARPSGVCMLSLIIPPKGVISRVRKMLEGELRLVLRVMKSRVNRKKCESVINSALSKLKLHDKVPPNGLALYCGIIMTEDGKETRVDIDFEPYIPINTTLYLMDNKFHTEPLNVLLKDDDTDLSVINNINNKDLMQCKSKNSCGNDDNRFAALKQQIKEMSEQLQPATVNVNAKKYQLSIAKMKLRHSEEELLAHEQKILELSELKSNFISSVSRLELGLSKIKIDTIQKVVVVKSARQQPVPGSMNNPQTKLVETANNETPFEKLEKQLLQISEQLSTALDDALNLDQNLIIIEEQLKTNEELLLANKAKIQEMEETNKTLCLRIAILELKIKDNKPNVDLIQNESPVRRQRGIPSTTNDSYSNNKQSPSSLCNAKPKPVFECCRIQ